MPTVFVDDESKKYLEFLRRKIPTEKVLTLKSLIELLLKFIRGKEEEFIKWVKEQPEGK
jgi:hypothetical protein